MFAVFALVLRVTIRDRLPVLATVFYATPLPVIVLLLAAAAACWCRPRSVLPLAGALLLAGWIAWPDTRVSPPANGGDGLRVVLWNVAHQGNATRTRAAFAPMNADVAVFVETGSVSDGAISAWAWPAAVATDGILVLARDRVVDEGPVDVGPSSRARQFNVRSGGTELRLIVADVRSNPFLSRAPPLRALLRHADSVEGPVLLLGDFNTPPESAWFDAYRESFAHAFEQSGQGWAPTWPSPIPVLHVDHVWMRGLSAVHAEHGWARGFDHRPVIVEIARKGL